MIFRGDEMVSFLDKLLNRNTNNNPLPVMQLDETGKIDPVATANLELAQQPLTVRDRLLGRELTKDVQAFNPETGEADMVTVVNRRNGLLDDMAKGYNENYNNRFSFNNIGQNQGWGTRIGEGLGTLGRFIDSPLGRGVLAAGLNSALGYNNSLQEGLTAAVGRQNAQTADRVYRQQLMRDYGYTDDDLANITGNIDSTMFNNLTKSQNSAMSLAIRQQTAQSMNNLRELQAEKQRIINSTLPEMQKAKLLQENAKAAHAEEMQLARINYYNNAVANPLGWGRLNLAREQFDYKKAQDAKEEAEESGAGTPSPFIGGTVKIQAPDGSVRDVPASQKDYYIKKGGKLL